MCYSPGVRALMFIGLAVLPIAGTVGLFAAMVWAATAMDPSAALRAKYDARVHAFDLTLREFRRMFAARRRV
jgi:hypothetical protein